MSNNATGVKNNETKPKDLETRRFSAAVLTTNVIIIVAIICILILLAFMLNSERLGIFTNSLLTPSPPPTVQTMPSKPLELTNTPPNYLTDTPESPQPTTAPYIIGSDWLSSCISTSHWQPYLASEIINASGQCYNLVKWGIAANNGNLLFDRSGFQSNTALEYGIVTDIRGYNRFNFSVRVKELSSSEVWLGFLEGDTIKSKGIAVVIQHDNNFDIRPLPNGIEYADNVHMRLADGTYKSIDVEFKGATMIVRIDKINIFNHPVGIAPTKLFLGYRALPNAEIEASIYHVEME